MAKKQLRAESRLVTMLAASCLHKTKSVREIRDVKVNTQQPGISKMLAQAAHCFCWSVSTTRQQLLMSVQVKNPMILCSSAPHPSQRIKRWSGYPGSPALVSQGGNATPCRVRITSHIPHPGGGRVTLQVHTLHVTIFV